MKYAYYYPVIDSLSTEIIQKLTGKDLKVLNILFMLFRIASKNLTLTHAYIQPSELYIKSKTKYSVCGISRTISKLTKLSIITTTHRRKRCGEWQTNIYHLGETMLQKVPWIRKALNKLQSSPFDQKSKLGHQKALKNEPEPEELISYAEWKRLLAREKGG